MIKIIFKCTENMNEHQEEFEFEDGTTDEEIQKEFEEWIWNEIGSYYCWYNVED